MWDSAAARRNGGVSQQSLWKGQAGEERVALDDEWVTQLFGHLLGILDAIPVTEGSS